MTKMVIKRLVISVLLLMLIVLPMSYWMQRTIQVKEFQKKSEELFWQIENIIEKNQQEIEEVKADLVKNSVMSAKVAAYVAQNHPQVIEDFEETMKLTRLLPIDELHFFDAEGSIYAGSNPEYYGYSFYSGEQMGYFLPMLTDHTLELCQDITPNTAENKPMQYAAVWSEDGRGIVQVGLEPSRVLKAMEKNQISNVFSMMVSEESAALLAIDAQSGSILGSTNRGDVGKTAQQLGFDPGHTTQEAAVHQGLIDGEKTLYLVREVDSLWLVSAYRWSDLHAKSIHSSLIISFFTLCISIITIFFIYLFINRKIVRGVSNINRDLQRIEQGNGSIRLTENSIPEFAQLSDYINRMVKSILDSPKKLSLALEAADIRVCIIEHMPNMKKVTATDYTKDILSLTDKEFEELLQNQDLLIQRKNEQLLGATPMGDGVLRLSGQNQERYVKETNFVYGESIVSVLVDITADFKETLRIKRERDTDRVTGLYNSRYFYSQADAVFLSPHLLGEAALLMIDADGLKGVNDRYGHEQGDRYLQALAGILRDYDTKNTILARLGGDEFIMLLYGYADREQLDGVIGSLLAQRDCGHMEIDGTDGIPIRFSVGVAYYPQDGADHHKLIRIADQRMYHEKRRRKNQPE